MYEFQWPTRTLFGEGLIEQAADFLPSPDPGACILIIAPGEAWAEPILTNIQDQLKRVGWSQVARFTEVEPNPSWETVTRGQDRAENLGVDCILAFGGGSAMDAAKVIAECCGIGLLCTIPTTAGTGGEISPWAVISNLQRREKESVVAKWPDLALLDPTLTQTMPPLTTLFTGIDAFVHGLEAYLSSRANPITDALAYKGMQLATQNLPLVLTDPQNLEARGSMMQASLLTGASMLHAGLGLMHAIGNVVGGLYHDLPHGQILAQCMEVVLEYNRQETAEKIAQIEWMLEQHRAVVETWFERLDVGKVELEEGDLSLLAERAATNVNAETNPRWAGKKEIRKLALQAFLVKGDKSRSGELEGSAGANE